MYPTATEPQDSPEEEDVWLLLGTINLFIEHLQTGILPQTWIHTNIGHNRDQTNNITLEIVKKLDAVNVTTSYFRISSVR